MIQEITDMLNADNLVSAFCKGDIEAHHFFCRLHFEELCQLAGAQVDNMQDAIKLTKEVVVRVWYRDNSVIQTSEDIKALLLRTLKYACTEFLCHRDNEKYILYRKRLEHYINTKPAFSNNQALNNLQSMDQQSIDRIRKILKIAFSQDIADETIAKELRMSVGEVSHSLHLAKQAISIILSENF